MRFRIRIAAVAGAAALAASFAAVSAPAAQATIGCSSVNDCYWANSYTGQVDHWYSAGGYFTGPHNGQQELCEVSPGLGVQFVIVGGTANGDCVAYVQGGQGAGIDARGCVFGQANETWYVVNGFEYQNQATNNKCLNVGTGSGDSWGVATCSDTAHTQAQLWKAWS